ncbi:hypothetical protein [Devosia sp. Leaf64]|uniref:hypothetical protein n=1 Tax=Devosia sp. Leaf64 TaxID=1736229 RepID=UPI0007161075|nr:hypothetical protein [Devosia sp. Leaf64]KQN78388.1 hypothetical protein ASE94_15550 [Devosia sp. Leaf64]
MKKAQNGLLETMIPLGSVSSAKAKERENRGRLVLRSVPEAGREWDQPKVGGWPTGKRMKMLACIASLLLKNEAANG